MTKIRELLLTAAFVALVVLGLHAIDRYTSRPLIYLEGTFPIYLEAEGWSFVVRYTVDGLPEQAFVPSEARAKRFIAYLRRVGIVINDASKAKDAKSSVGLVDRNP